MFHGQTWFAFVPSEVVKKNLRDLRGWSRAHRKVIRDSFRLASTEEQMKFRPSGPDVKKADALWYDTDWHSHFRSPGDDHDSDPRVRPCTIKQLYTFLIPWLHFPLRQYFVRINIYIDIIISATHRSKYSSLTNNQIIRLMVIVPYSQGNENSKGVIGRCRYTATRDIYMHGFAMYRRDVRRCKGHGRGGGASEW
jgi:hypothetical protein